MGTGLAAAPDGGALALSTRYVMFSPSAGWRPDTCSRDHRLAAVDHDVDRVEIGGIVGGEAQRDSRDVRGLAEAAERVGVKHLVDRVAGFVQERLDLRGDSQPRG